jgi:hypothetical protein
MFIDVRRRVTSDNGPRRLTWRSIPEIESFETQTNAQFPRGPSPTNAVALAGGNSRVDYRQVCQKVVGQGDETFARKSPPQV